MGFAYSPLSLTVLREASPETQGASTAGLQLSDVLGTALGTGIGGALIAAGARAGRRGVGRPGGDLRGRRRRRRDRAVARGRLPRGGHATAPCHARTADAARAAAEPGDRRRGDRSAAASRRARLGARPRGLLTAAQDGARGRHQWEDPQTDVSRGPSREDPRDPGLPEAGNPLLRHHDAAQGRGRVPRGDRPDDRALQGRGDRHRRRHGVARLHLQLADGVPAGRRPRARPQARQAAGRDDHGRVRARVRLEHARDPPRRDPGGPEGADRRRPARDGRHGARARSSSSSDSRARSSAWRSSSSSTSSRAATGSRAAASRASSGTDAPSQRAPRSPR